MKKSFLLLPLAAALVLGAGVGASGGAAEGEKMGVERISFQSATDLSKFDLYSSFGSGFYIQNETLWTNRSGEQKAILKDYTFNDFSFSMDLVTPVRNAYLDGGIYFGVTGAVDDGIDAINAWQICIVRESGHNVFAEDNPDVDVRLYRFTYVNGTTSYTSVEERVAAADSEVSVRVEMKDKTLSVYVSGNEMPALTRTIDDYAGGGLGLRTFYCSMGFDNIEIFADSLPVDREPLRQLLSEANAEKGGDYTMSSLSALHAAIAEAEQALAGADQRAIDGAASALQNALDGLTARRDRAALNEAIARAEQLNEENYTRNGWLSLQSVLATAKAFDSDDEQALSELCLRLEGCIKDLNRVFGEVAK